MIAILTITSMFLQIRKIDKMLRKIHEEIVDSYSEQISHLSKKTIQSYANITCRFLLYSPSVSIEDKRLFNERIWSSKDGRINWLSL